MNIQELLSQIIEMSHNEVAPDVALKENALKWLNSAYFEMMEVCLPFLQEFLQKEILISGENNLFILPADLKRILGVYQVQPTSKKLYGRFEKTLGYDFVLFKNEKGETCLQTEENARQLSVQYTPLFLPLEETTQENDILVPSAYRGALIWGSMVWASLYERGFHTSSELNLFQQKWEEAKREAKLALATQASLRGEPVSDY